MAYYANVVELLVLKSDMWFRMNFCDPPFYLYLVL